MRATGIVRRIDDLGRVVIPKEIRKTFKINEGSPLEIFTDIEGNVIFKKYSPVGEITSLAEIFVDVISKVYSCGCIIADVDKIVAVSGVPKSEFLGKTLSAKMIEFLENKRVFVTDQKIAVCDNSYKNSDVSAVISSSGETLGAIMLVGVDMKKEPNIKNILNMLANLLGRQAE